MFDINCCDNGSGWVARQDWEAIVAPHILAHIRRAYPRWHITHGVEIEA